MKQRATLVVVIALIAAACGDGTADRTTTAETATTAAPTTAAPTTTTAAPTTTTVPPALFTATDLAAAVLIDGDPWAVPPAGTSVLEPTIDDIWPLDDEFFDFSAERAVYEAGGFEASSFSLFVEDDGLVITAAHLFDGEEGAAAAFDTIVASFSDTALVAGITGLAPSDLDTVEVLDAPNLGDRAAAVRLTGDAVQVVGVVWITGNMLQFVRAAMALGDTTREAASFAVAEAMAGRVGG